jgi:hypothetical protein
MDIQRLTIKLLLTLFAVLVCACGPKGRPVLFPVQGTNQVLFGFSREAAEGSLDLSRPKKFEYRFAAAPVVPPPASFEIEYTLTGERQVILEAGGRAWVLPGQDNSIFHYAIPTGDIFPDSFNITTAGGADENRNGIIRMQIHSVKFTDRWYGFYSLRNDSGNHIYASPFVSRRPDDSVWVIDPPAGFGVPAGFFPAFSAALPPEKGIAVDAGSLRFEAWPQLERFNIPAGIIAPGGPLVVSGEPDSFRLGYVTLSPLPAPITADPGMALAWPAERWRDRRYEVFRWENFPSLLIFDTADYAVQDRMFKRLAFFVEKAGFRGRLANDDEIAELHGWNAHDYRAEDLANFFHTARQTNFPMLAEERELERILLSSGLIRESGSGIQGGEGGVISISRESADYLRFRFMAHEGFHGLFFIDEDFRAFSRRRWQQFPAEAKRFIVSFFNFQRYDTADEYLLINEFMAHVLQQPVSQAGYYFGQTLPSRLEDTWRQAHLPAKDEASGSWPTLARAFTREARAFSAYVGSRGGLAAGRVHLVTVRQP